jgi:hypothetical protein
MHLGNPAGRVKTCSASERQAQDTPLHGKEAAAYVGRTEQALQHLIHWREIVVVRKGRRSISTAVTWIVGFEANEV